MKNLSFLLDESGYWRLSPAYDLTVAMGRGFTRRHQMSVGGKREGITPEDLLDLGRKFGIEDDGQEAIEAVGESLTHWEELATAAGVEEQRRAEIDEVLQERGFVLKT